MNIHIKITTGRIPDHLSADLPAGEAGAWVEFRGIVRADEDGKTISALEYEAYLPMAEAEMRKILLKLAAQAPCLSVRLIHRIGVVPVGEAAMYLGIAARHRKEAFALLAAFMDQFKKDVPIWKVRALSWSADAVIDGGSPQPSKDAALRPGEVIALLQKICHPLDTERVPLASASGRVLREPVHTKEDQPAFDRSSMDGYAVRLDDASTTFRVVDEIRAGDWKPRVLQAGEAVRIGTGGALPGDGLQVVMREDVRVEGETICVVRREKDRNIRFKGEDARARQVLVEPGTVLEPGTLALLASVGCADPLVTRLPRVLHAVTGNEIVAAEANPARGQIRDSNSTLVRAFLEKWRIVPRQIVASEDEPQVERALCNSSFASEKWDLLLISGGASVGEHDFTRRILERGGFQIHVSKTSSRPGKPLIVAQRGRTMAFGLPGNPLAHYVCLNLYVRVALSSFAGLPCDAEGLFQAGTLAEALDAGGNARETFWPARWSLREGAAVLTPLRWCSSGDLTSLAQANALIRVGPGARTLDKGRQVEFVLT